MGQGQLDQEVTTDILPSHQLPSFHSSSEILLSRSFGLPPFLSWCIQNLAFPSQCQRYGCFSRSFPLFSSPLYLFYFVPGRNVDQSWSCNWDRNCCGIPQNRCWSTVVRGSWSSGCAKLTRWFIILYPDTYLNNVWTLNEHWMDKEHCQSSKIHFFAPSVVNIHLISYIWYIISYLIMIIFLYLVSSNNFKRFSQKVIMA